MQNSLLPSEVIPRIFEGRAQNMHQRVEIEPQNIPGEEGIPHHHEPKNVRHDLEKGHQQVKPHLR